MPSVQELLAALEADKSPFISLMEGVAGGYANAQQDRVKNAMQLMQLQQMREQQARQQEMDRQIKAQIEGQTQSQLRGLGGPSTVLPGQKFEQTISQDEKGNYSRSFKTVDTTPKNVETVIYQTPTGENRIGKKDVTGAVIQTPSDPLAPNQPKAEPLPLDQQLDLREKAKLKALQPKEHKFLTSATSGYDRIIQEATAIRDNPDLSYAVGFAAPLARIPSTSARAVRARINTLISKTALNTLQDIRQSSPTGGALGNISDKDTALLKDQIASLDTGMSEKDFKDALNRVIEFAVTSKKRLQQGYDETYSGVTPQPRSGGSTSMPTPKKIGRFTVTVE